jgi:hypothetical protein
MPTPEAEEIIKAAWADAHAGIDALAVVQRHAPRIDALLLRKISDMEFSWRNALRLERAARAEAERQAGIYLQELNSITTGRDDT